MVQRPKKNHHWRLRLAWFPSLHSLQGEAPQFFFTETECPPLSAFMVADLKQPKKASIRLHLWFWSLRRKHFQQTTAFVLAPVFTINRYFIRSQNGEHAPCKSKNKDHLLQDIAASRLNRQTKRSFSHLAHHQRTRQTQVIEYAFFFAFFVPLKRMDAVCGRAPSRSYARLAS